MDKKTLESLTKEALDAFWHLVVERYPQAKSGDLPPPAAIELDRVAEKAIQVWVDRNVSIMCKTCGSEIVETINDSNFNDGECGGCEYERYRLQPQFAEALDHLLEQTVDMDLAHGIELTEGEREAREKALARFAKTNGNAK